MSDTSRRATIRRRTTQPPPSPPGLPAQSTENLAARMRVAAELAALVQLAELDAVSLQRRGGPPGAHKSTPTQRHALTAKLSADTLDAYVRAMRAGRQPAVVRLEASVCSGCHVRLHSTLDQRIRRHRGAAACPHCLRLVYDPTWLEAEVSRG